MANFLRNSSITKSSQGRVKASLPGPRPLTTMRWGSTLPLTKHQEAQVTHH